jgi:Phosphotransferase enzyme family
MQDLMDKIAARIAWEQRENPIARNYGDVPVSYDAITLEWLTAILCKDHPGCEVTAFNLDTPDQGSTNRRRIFLSYNKNDGSLPASVFCKCAHDATNRYTLTVSGAAAGEIFFYGELRPQLDIEAPRSWYAAADEDAYTSIVVMEDIASSVEFCDHNTVMTRERAESQIRLIATLHSRFDDGSQLGYLEDNVATWPICFHRSREAFALDQYCTEGFIKAREVVPPSLFAREAEVWPATLKSVELHNTLPKTLIHSDVHLKNWYIADNGKGEMGLSDWQLLCVGNWGRDFAYTISTALTVENRRAWEMDLLKLYLSERERLSGYKLDFEEALIIYRQQLFGALAWWTITLNPMPGMPDMQPPAASMIFIERITNAINDLNALDAF